MNGPQSTAGSSQRPPRGSLLRDVSPLHAPQSEVRGPVRFCEQGTALPGRSVHRQQQRCIGLCLGNRPAAWLDLERIPSRSRAGAMRCGLRHAHATGRAEPLLAIRPDMVLDRCLWRKARHRTNAGRPEPVGRCKRKLRSGYGPTWTGYSPVRPRVAPPWPSLDRIQSSQGALRLSIGLDTVPYIDLPGMRACLGALWVPCSDLPEPSDRANPDVPRSGTACFIGFGVRAALLSLARKSTPGTQFGVDGESTQLSHQLTGPGSVGQIGSTLPVCRHPGFRKQHTARAVPSQRAMAAAKAATLGRGVRADRQDTARAVSTQPEAGKQFDVSTDSVQRARKVLDKGSDDLKKTGGDRRSEEIKTARAVLKQPDVGRRSVQRARDRA